MLTTVNTQVSQSGCLQENATGTPLVKRVSRLLWNQTFMPYLRGIIIPLDYILGQLNPIHTKNPLYLWSTMIWYRRILLGFIYKTFVLISLIPTPPNQHNLFCWIGKTVSHHNTQFSPSSISLFHFNSKFSLQSTLVSYTQKHLFISAVWLRWWWFILFFPVKCAIFLIMIMIFFILSS